MAQGVICACSGAATNFGSLLNYQTSLPPNILDGWPFTANQLDRFDEMDGFP